MYVEISFNIDNSGTSPEINYTTKTSKNQLGFTDFCVKSAIVATINIAV